MPDERVSGAPALRLGAALRRAWIGYRRRLDAELAATGFADRGFPDGRVLRICRRSGNATISQVGRELAITRQGASKVVSSLARRGYVTLSASPSDGREKVVQLTEHGINFLAAHRRATMRIERELRMQLGDEAFDSLQLLLHALGGDEQPRLSEYLRSAWNLAGPFDPDA